MCTERGSRCASRAATVDLPDAIAPVITMTLPAPIEDSCTNADLP